MGSTLTNSVGLGNSTGHPMLGHQQDSLGSINSPPQHLQQATHQQQPTSFGTPDSISSSTSRLGLHGGQQGEPRLPTLSTAPVASLTSSLSTSSSIQALQSSPPSALSAQFPTAHLHNTGQFPLPSTPFGMTGSASVTPSMLSPGMYQSAAGSLGQLKPYRPWGAELAY